MADLGLSKLLDSLFSPPTWIQVDVRFQFNRKFYCIAFHNFSTKQDLAFYPCSYSYILFPGVISSLELTEILRQHGVLVVRPARVDGSLRFSSEVLSCLRKKL